MHQLRGGHMGFCSKPILRATLLHMLERGKGSIIRLSSLWGDDGRSGGGLESTAFFSFCVGGVKSIFPRP